MSIVIAVTCYICNQQYPVDKCTEIIFESMEAYEENHYVCPYCLRDILWEVRLHMKEIMEKLRKVSQNPSER